jgi:aspartate 1-decarboxylase
METINLLHAKLHRVRITERRPDYVGSLGIDSRWMKKVGILPLQEIHCWNVTRGTRWITYALAAKPGSKEISPNGACALLCEDGDILIIGAFKQRNVADVRSEGHRARVLIFGADNEAAEYVEQDVTVDGDDFEFTSRTSLLSDASKPVQAAAGAAA